jgi:hypothetical protein
VAPSQAEARKQARHWLRVLGIDPDELAQQYPQLAAGASGRRKHPSVPRQFLAGVELFVRIIRRDYDGRKKPKMTRKKAIQWFAEAACLHDPQWAEKDPEKFATFAMASKDAKAFASHIEKELRRSGLSKTPTKKLLPLGIDARQLSVSTPPQKYFSV